ncbi:MAG: hypothetical protein LRY52_06085 [Sulfurospirillum cavolei]|nr:hypothetical protein [Sulfurospirillum cavolei]
MNYIALTIGPIYKTLKNAKKTRELWGGSYIFSYMMKKIIEPFKERTFITPYIDDSVFESGKEVGLFHDRFIFVSHEGDKHKLTQVIEAVFEELSRHTPLHVNFLKEYFQIHFLEVALPSEANPILELTPYLESSELFYSVGHYQKNELSQMLQGNNSFLTQEAFGEEKHFPSLPEIALHDMMDDVLRAKINAHNDEVDVYDDLKNLKPYHKYIAIVHADGDTMSEVIKDTKHLSKTSKNLFEFCTSSHERIKAFGGQTIFAGGDDLLFFAPVVSHGKTIFELLDALSSDFNDRFKTATLSFGLSITYYKFPLYEALEKSRNLLFEKAKKRASKNNIAYEVQKHSGQIFGGIVHKGNQSAYEKFLAFVGFENALEETFLHSLHHKIDMHKVTLEAIKSDKTKLQNFFDNYFNESGHEKYQAFFKKLIDYIKEEQDIHNVHAVLRFIKFIKGDKQ